MALDYTTVRDKLKSKQGYTVSPLARMLSDLKALLIDMTAQRAAGSCPSNAAFDAASPASVGDYNAAADGIRGLTCACQGVSESCGCQGVGCVCNGESIGCVCNTQSERVCSCDSYGECPLVSGCSSVSGNICSSVSQSGCSGLADNCECDADAEYGCPSYAEGCGCDTYQSGCECDAVVTQCPCDAYFNQ
ncbi:MAG: hypothetical protein IJC25_06000 [Clostridia bacterium]|nr:hypothetical protein [Clostridia bacterium]